MTRALRGPWAAMLSLALLAGAHGAIAQPADPPVPATAGEDTFPLIAILCYHDVSRDSLAPLQTVSPEFLSAQIRACRADGWTFLPLSEVLAQREHPERLPPRVLVMTFDDGYRSFAEQALPILRAGGIRPTLSIITSFVDQPHPDMPPLLTWAELGAIDSAGDAEIASHSHALHRYERSNPYGDTAPAVAVRRYLAAEKRYENREEYRSRVGDDLAWSQHVLRDRLGHTSPVLVWPYGMHDEMARGLAARAGFSATLALGWRPVTPADLRSGCLPRIMVTRRMSFGPNSDAWLHPPVAPVRAAEVDLDAIWDPDEAVFRARLDHSVRRVRALGATTVILPVCPEPRGDGRLSQAWAMNHQLPVRADVWSMAAAKFAAARLRVWVRAPAMNLTWAWERHPDWRIHAGQHGAPTRWGSRLSPDLPGVRAAAADFFTDLAVYLPIDGVLFDDDAMMLPGERLAVDGDASAAGKSAAIRGLLEACKQAVRAWRPECRFARCVSADVVGRPGLDPRNAQDYADCLAYDDLTVIFPKASQRDGGRTTPRDIERLGRRAIAAWREAGPRGAADEPPVLLMLPTYDDRSHDWIAAPAQRELAAAALRSGLFHLGTSPVAATGTLPVGLLDIGGLAPAERNVMWKY